MSRFILIISGLILFSCQLMKSKNIEKHILFQEQIWEDGKYNLIETIFYDIDKDNINDTIKIFKIQNWLDPGDFHKIQITLTTNKSYDIYNTGDWINIESDEFKALPNKIDSKRILITNIAPQKELIIIDGYSYASTPQKLTILGFVNGNIKPLYQNNFYLKTIQKSANNVFSNIVGWGYFAESFGYEDSISIGIGYSPYFVLKVSNDTIKIDTIASEMYNYKHYIGYFGLAFDTDGRYLTIRSKEYFTTKDEKFKPYFYFEKHREFPQTSLRFLSKNELQGYTKKELRLMRNEIFAFHGYRFSSKDLNEYFSKLKWYKPADNLNIGRRLNKYERENIKLIKIKEEE